jgi:ABC-2 type transport system permease protein
MRMMSLSTEAEGSVYDLGYRTYEGVRLGRLYAVLSLYVTSLRGVFGFGRHTSSKILPFALVIIALLPAVIQLGVVATVEIIDFDLVSADDYYEFVQWPLALFVAVAAPELVGRDQRNRTLALYFSRPLLRGDYILAKMAALSTALLIIALIPEAVVFIGNAMAQSDPSDYLRDNWRDIAPIVISGAMIAVLWSSIGLAIGSQTDRWPLSSGGIVAYFAVSWILASILINTSDEGVFRYSLLFSGFHVARAFTLWVFGVTPRVPVFGEDDSLGGDLALADVSLFVYAAAAVLTVSIALFIVHLRYRRMSL